MNHSSSTFSFVVALLVLTGCTSARFENDEAPTYQQSIGQLLRAKCARCHAGPAPPAGWRADTYEAAVGCLSAGNAVLEGPLASALARPDHASLVTAEERTELERWAAAGGPSVRPATHERAFLDPRSADGHGNFLRARRYRPMLVADDADACGRCHDGVAAKPTGSAFAAPGASSCTTCHDQPGGTFACTTCHGTTTPRDPCFHPESAADRAHPAHTAGGTTREAGLACGTCHPQPLLGDVASPNGTHANGHVEVWFDFAVAGRAAAFDASSKRCTGTCHGRGGNRGEPAWTEAAGRPLACNDCHQSPPPDHYRGPCTTCHLEADATGTKLTAPKLHINGHADLGDGSGTCGACHGTGIDPWPKSGAHSAHAAPNLAKPVACETCHDLPTGQHPLGKERADVRLLGLATSGAHRATFDPATQTCSETYCHAGRGAATASPRWTDGPPARACGACHSIPPPAPHPASTTCEGCHPISTTANHVDGLVTR